MLHDALARILAVQIESRRPLGIIVAGHNGSGKSTMWNAHLSDRLQIPLINADRMMLSILPEVSDPLALPPWAVALRDRDASWMRVAQLGVESFVAQAMVHQVPFAMETVFSHWTPRPDGTVASKIEKIRELQDAGYFVLLLFVGLANADLSIARVLTRRLSGGHGVPEVRLRERFPRTQRAIASAQDIADATILLDNSLGPDEAYRVCRIQFGPDTLYDIRREGPAAPAITEWLDRIAPAP